MHAVLCIDLQLRLALLIRHVFVNLRGAEAALRPVVDRQRDLQRHLRLLWLHLQVRGLVVLVVHTAPDQVIKDFECVNAVRLWVLNLLAGSSRLRVLGVLLAPLEGPRLHAPREHERRGAIGHARHHAQMPGWLEVPHGVELFPNPRALDTVLVHRQLHGGRALAQQSLRGGLARERAGLHGRVAALDLRHVEESRSATSDHAAREGQLRNRLDAALVQDPGAIGDASAPLQKCLHTRVQLELLELLVRAQVGVRVVQANDHADVNQVALHVVDEGTTISHLVQWPADCVHDRAGAEVLVWDLPYFLDAEAVVLRAHALAEVVLLHDGLAQGASATLREDGLLAEELHASRVLILLLAILGDPDVLELDADHLAVLSEDGDVGREAWVDLHTHRLGLLREPAAQLAQRADVVAVLPQRRRQVEEGRRDRDRSRASGQPIERVARHRGV
mmetsp:Transcript_100221/g.269175  ORF Transcript_100221/g.269175 Transcript_100221/m.269175 type:complete len:448 (+) Transcript_100221:603-1946(+)